MMRAVRAGAGVVGEAAIPTASPSQVLIRVVAAGVSRPDVLQDSGLYPARPGQTDVLGLEVAGVVASGPHAGQAGLADLAGEEVCALIPGGGYAEWCVAERRHLLELPFARDDPERFRKAAALPECVMTVWNNLFRAGPDALKGKAVLVHGGASGIGTTAIQLAKSFGASHVAATAGSAERCRFVTDEVGADACFDYTREGAEAWDKQTERVDVVLDMVGGDYVQRNLGVLRQSGRLVCIGFLGGSPKARVDFSRVMLKNLTITGSVLRSASVEHKVALRDAVAEHVWPRIRDGSLRLPVLGTARPELDLADYKDAHAALQASQTVGKEVLSVSPVPQ